MGCSIVLVDGCSCSFSIESNVLFFFFGAAGLVAGIRFTVVLIVRCCCCCSCSIACWFLAGCWLVGWLLTVSPIPVDRFLTE